MGSFVTMIIIREKSAEVLSKMVMDKLVMLIAGKWDEITETTTIIHFE